MPDRLLRFGFHDFLNAQPILQPLKKYADEAGLGPEAAYMHAQALQADGQLEPAAEEIADDERGLSNKGISQFIYDP